MNTQIHNIFSGTVKTVAIAILLVLSTSSAFAENSYYQKTLFEPGDATLRAESRGRIMIYDGMDSKTVDRAMDEQFDRIDNMMFVRTHYADEDGEDYYDDDGCD